MKIPAFTGARLARFLTSWVNLDVRDEATAKRDTALFGFMFALPTVALTSTALQTPMGEMGQAVASLALAFSLPTLAAGYLSLSGSKFARTAISVLSLPAFYLAATQASSFFTESALLVGLLAGLARRESLIGDREMTIGAALTGMIALSGGLPAAAVSALLGLAAFAMSTKRGQTAKLEIATFKNDDLKTIIPMIIGTSGFLFETDRTGKIFESYGVFGAFKGEKLAEVVHVADLVKLLTALDGLEAGLIKHAGLDVRLTNPATPASQRQYGRCSLQLSKYGERILVCGQVETVAGVDEAAPAEIAPVATVCHELRTPLNAIIGFSEMLANGLAGALANERQTEYAGLINKSGRHLLEVVNSMLDLSAAGNGKVAAMPTTFLPDEVAMLSVNMLAGQAKAKKIGLDYTPVCAFEPFVGDRRICQQILVNLLSNSVKYTGAGGTIRLSVDMTGNLLTLEVSDTGIGMTKPDLARAGTPYFRVVKNEETQVNHGTGLGLALVRKMTEQHGGSMEIESTPGEGTRVRVVLRQLTMPDGAQDDSSTLLPPKEDESAKLIYLSEEPFDETPRKTA